MKDRLQVLREVFGFSSFRGLQEEVVDHALEGGDCLVLMPTGGGKSLCYQLPAVLRRGTAIVISPLIALMEDQVQHLEQMGVRVGSLHSGMQLEELYQVEQQLGRQQLDLLYVSPERALSRGFFERIRHLDLALFAIDEAHCVSQWGHDFRPEYSRLVELVDRFPGVPRMALTATADEPTRNDILDQLALRRPRVFRAGFDRPNIFYQALVKHQPAEQLTRFLKENHQGNSGIVYVQTRNRTERVAHKLTQKGFQAIPYHAGMTAEERRKAQTRFLREEGLIVVATVAFGMGIDKSNVRFVAHLDMPKSLEAYYQETGRAGRDGLPADAWMAFGLADVVGMRQLMQNSQADLSHRQLETRKLDAMLGYCETTFCRRKVLLSYFGDQAADNCGACDNCLSPPKTWNATVEAQKVLSCVYRTGQRYGARYLVDVLRGKPQERIVQNQHDKLPTFGVGQDLDLNTWMSVIRQLVAGGLLNVDMEGYGSLTLTPESAAILRGEREVQMRRDPKRVKTKKKKGTTAPIPSGDSELWAALRTLRLEFARKQGVPPYVIFHDSTLHSMLLEKPTDMASMAQISGVGQKKLERYGEAFLALLRDFASERS